MSSVPERPTEATPPETCSSDEVRQAYRAAYALLARLGHEVLAKREAAEIEAARRDAEGDR